MDYSQIARSENRESRYGGGQNPEASDSRYETAQIRTPSRYDRGPSFLEKSIEHIQRSPALNTLHKLSENPSQTDDVSRTSEAPAGKSAESRRHDQPVQPKTLK